MDIGQRVREIRKDLGMSAAELARRTGVARNTIVMIEAGSRTPSLGLVEKIAHELRREPADLFKEPVPLGEEPPSDAQRSRIVTGEAHLKATPEQYARLLDIISAAASGELSKAEAMDEVREMVAQG